MAGMRRSTRPAARVSYTFVVPGGFIVGTRSGIKPGEQPVVRQLEAFLHDERGVRVVDEIILGDAVVFDRVANQPAEERDVGTGANLEEKISGSGRASESRVN